MATKAARVREAEIGTGAARATGSAARAARVVTAKITQCFGEPRRQLEPEQLEPIVNPKFATLSTGRLPARGIIIIDDPRNLSYT